FGKLATFQARYFTDAIFVETVLVETKFTDLEPKVRCQQQQGKAEHKQAGGGNLQNLHRYRGAFSDQMKPVWSSKS
ncbi:MAG: hypothetical protein COS88_04210, partial [Chloroflexi bacterium CG07_land_8_20_14_0_80_51_10]